MNLSFLAESKKGMLWQPRVVESGREGAAGFGEKENEKRKASVLKDLFYTAEFRNLLFKGSTSVSKKILSLACGSKKEAWNN